MADSGPVVRVKLDLCSAIPHRGPQNLVWIVIDKAVTTTISQFAKLIRTKYGVAKRSELYLDDALLPPDEPIRILRDKDTVRIVTAAQQPSNSGSRPDDDPESSPAIAKLIKKEIKQERSEIGETIKEEVKRERPEIGEHIKQEAKRKRPDINEPIKKEVERERPKTADQVKSTPAFHSAPASLTLQNQSPVSTPGWSVITPDPLLVELQSSAQRKRRPRHKKKKPAEYCMQVAESTSSPQLPLGCMPSYLAQADLSTGKRRCFDGDAPGEAKEVALQENAVPTPAKPPPCIVHLAVSTKNTEKGCQPPVENGQDSQVPVAASCHSAIHPPPEAVTSKAKIQKVVKKISAMVKSRFTEDDWAQDFFS
ncbi:uncharacterized protein [Dermacentor andersoni]|uniref:uncharacterized protein isoform X2 n=1 Tax=Dermacentor andersoni TaxID=34620 RepID=UPI002416C340|nr:uncharacterized protein LOC126525691 isoform X2 [Dermacentor andersoni]